MPSFLSRLGLSQKPDVLLAPQSTHNSADAPVSDGEAKTAHVSGGYDEKATASSFPATELANTATEPEADKIIAPGELSFEEDTAGGMGRHLGLVSTTFLMFVPSSSLLPIL